MAATSDVVPDYEEMFAHRFTANDPEYQEYVKRGIELPPILDEWRGRSGGQQRNRDQRFQDNRPFRGHERWDWSNRPDQYGQGRGWGNSYQGHRQGQSYYSPRGQQNSYNSYNPRPHRDYY